MMKGFSVQHNFTTCDKASASTPNKAKKRRTLSVNTESQSAPNTEVIAMSPKTLLATNRFICQICSKGFKREQNLQLHRRGHNLPWKLKKISGEEATEKKKKKVYICPEKSCPHHDRRRALGDLTGIKKHFGRKHGEKKWCCDKCCKKYAVFSDWKAHARVCGTREYRCGCGAIFSRRDNFITHKAFCDILTEETKRTIRTHPLAMDQNQLFLLPQPTSMKNSTLNPSMHSSSLHENSLAIMSKDDEDNGLFSSQEMEFGGFFEEEMGEFMAPKKEGDGDGMTRDLLGLVDPSYKDLLMDMAGKDACMGSSSFFEQHKRT